MHRWKRHTFFLLSLHFSPFPNSKYPIICGRRKKNSHESLFYWHNVLVVCKPNYSISHVSYTSKTYVFLFVFLDICLSMYLFILLPSAVLFTAPCIFTSLRLLLLFFEIHFNSLSILLFSLLNAKLDIGVRWVRWDCMHNSVAD